MCLNKATKPIIIVTNNSVRGNLTPEELLEQEYKENVDLIIKDFYQINNIGEKMKRKVLRITGHYPEDSSTIVEKLQLLLPNEVSSEFYISSNLQIIELPLINKEVSVDDSFKILDRAESFIKEAFAPSNKINVSLEVD